MIHYIEIRIRIGRLAMARVRRLIRNTPRLDDATFRAVLARINSDLDAVGIV